MKTILIDTPLFDINSSQSEGLISGLILLQSKGIKLYLNGVLKNLNPLMLKILKSEKISIQEKNKNLTYDFIVIPKWKNLLLVNNDTKLKSFEAAAEFIVSEFRFIHIIRKTKETDISVQVSLDRSEERRVGK